MVNEIVTKFKFLGDLKPQKSFNANLKTSINALGAFAAASKIAAAGAFAWAANMFGPIDAMGNLAAETKNSAAELTAWGYVAAQNNSSVQAMSTSMTVLTRRMGQYAKFGSGPAKEAIEALGLSVKNTDGTVKNSSETMLDIADAMRGLSEGEQLSMLRKLGIDASMLQTLRMTREEIQALQGEAHAMGIVSDEDTENVLKFGTAMGKLKFGMTSVQNMVAVAFAPMMTELVDSFSDVLAANRDWIVGGLKWLGTVITATSGFVSRMWPVLAAIAAGFVAAKIATIGFGTVMGVVLSPVVLITAGIVALLLIIDDLMVALNGGKSIIADFFMGFFGVDIVPVLQGIVDVFNDFVGWMTDAVQPLLSFFKNIFGAVGALFRGDLGGAIDFVGAAFKDLGGYIANLFKGALFLITGGLDGLAGAFTRLADFAGGVFKPFFKYISSMISVVSSLFKGDFSGAIGHVKGTFTNLVDAVWGLFTGLFSLIDDGWNAIGEFFKSFTSDSVGLFAPLFDYLGSIFGVIGAIFKGDMDGAIEHIVDAISSLGEFILGVFTGLFSLIDDGWNAIGEFFKSFTSDSVGLFAPLFDYLGSIFGVIGAIFKGDMDGAIEHIVDAISSLGEFILGVFTGAFDAITGLWGVVASYIKEKAMSMLPQWAIDLLTGVGGAVSGAASSAWSGAKSFLGFGGEEAVDVANGGRSTNSSVEQNIEMTITSNDPYTAGNVAADRLRDENNRAKQLAKRGGQ